MASAPRVNLSFTPPGERNRPTLLLQMVPESALERFLQRIGLFVHRLLRREPTLFIELGAAYTVAVWSICILLPDALTEANTLRAEQPRILEETACGLIGVVVASAQFASILLDHSRADSDALGHSMAHTPSKFRGYLSFISGSLLGYLGGAFIAIDPLLPAGWVYLGFGVASVLPFWRSARKSRVVNRSQ